MTTKATSPRRPKGWWSRRRYARPTRAPARGFDAHTAPESFPHDGSSALSDSRFVALNAPNRSKPPLKSLLNRSAGATRSQWGHGAAARYCSPTKCQAPLRRSQRRSRPPLRAGWLREQQRRLRSCGGDKRAVTLTPRQSAEIVPKGKLAVAGVGASRASAPLDGEERRAIHRKAAARLACHIAAAVRPLPRLRPARWSRPRPLPFPSLARACQAFRGPRAFRARSAPPRGALTRQRFQASAGRRPRECPP
jgi:hypothetical protein